MLETDLPFVSLWYAIGGEYTERDGDWQMTAGDPPRSVIIASEPLTTDHSSWLEVPEYSMLTAELTPDGRRVRDARPGCLTARPSTSSPPFPLFEGRSEADLVELARVMRRRTVREGEILWRQGDDAREMVFIVEGAVSASLRVAGDRAVEIGEGRSGGDGRRDRAARRRDAHDERARDRDRDGARARPAGFRGAARPPASVGVQPEAPPRVALHRTPSQPARGTSPARSATRGRPPAGMRRRRSPTWSTAARPTASTCVAWRPSTTSTRWRSGAS